MSLKYLLYAGLVLVFSGGVPINSAPSGFLIGHLKIVFLGAAESAEEPSDEMPRPAVDPETYGEYPLIILSPSDKKEIAHVTADENGNYRVALPPGAYLLDVQDRATKRIRAQPQPFTIVANETVRADMNIVIGFR